MLSMRKTWWGLPALCLLAVAVAPAGAAPAPNPNRARVPAERMIPADTEGVIVFNWREMLDSPMVKKQLPEAKKVLQKNEPAQQILKAVGLDPFRDIDNVMIAFSQAGGGDGKMLVVVRGNFDLAKVAKAAAAHAEKNPGKLKITREKGVRVYEIEAKGQNKPLFAAFADSSTLIASPTKEYTLDRVAKAKETPVPLNAHLKAALAKTATKDALWFTVVATEQIKEQLGKSPQTKEFANAVDSLTGGVSIGDNLKLTVKINCKNADTAASIRKKLDAFKPVLKFIASSNEKAAPIINDFLDHLDIAAVKDSAKVTLEVTPEMIEKISKLVKEQQ
jgi:hypothetical protein